MVFENVYYKSIPKFKGYFISETGVVISNKRNLVKKLKTNVDTHGYLTVSLYNLGKSRTLNVHKLMAITYLGHKPNGHNIIIDHKDNNKENNTLDNLQLITHRENLSKDKKGGSSKYVGVSWDKKNNKWLSSITINSVNVHLGRFDKEEDASEAYKNKLLTLNK